MTDPKKQQVGPRGIRILGMFVLVYLAIGSHMYFNMDLPSIAYILYGIVSWVAGMMLFYKLHRSYMADLAEQQ
ncbi:MAG: hypothetical protein ABEH40_00485 [Haloferacaceae archaeon]